MLKVKQQRRRNRKLPDHAMPPPPPLVGVTSVVAGTNQVTVNFASQVQLAGSAPPASWIFGIGNFAALSVAAHTPTSLTLALPGAVLAGQHYSILPYDPAVRSTTGGYVGASSGSLV